ncbi:MAG: HPr family phosphocarrier protein [Colwellia sp.]
MHTVSKELTIKNKLGLHARAATKLAQVSLQYKAKVTVELNEKKADADSIMALMLLAGGQGKLVNITAQGEDAQQALTAVCQLITDKFDEEE